jgi:hypothetical protein
VAVLRLEPTRALGFLTLGGLARDLQFRTLEMTTSYLPSSRGSLGAPERSDTVRALARFGYACKGIVYGLIGVLALLAAFGSEEGRVGGGGEAVRSIALAPFGQVLCVVVGIGLLAYAAWRIAEGALDLRMEGRDAKGIAKRLGHAGSGVANGALGVLALDIVIGSRPSGGEPSTWIGKLMGSSIGTVVVVAIGLGLVLYGLSEIVKGWTESFERDLSLERMTLRARRFALNAGKLGFIAHGVVLPIVGLFLLHAVLQRSPGQARGIGGALHEIASQPFGQVLLAVVAFGLACYGAFQIVFAKYGRLAKR